ncbi:putative fatty acyl-CoA reductase CG5065, partial [Chrysoperla carnea]|uniref:putative fatty acyl-CoA reductase CG5065 n=1 Tax=Chrysoperla carnea TaxID=189513 RepID=UPI001D08683B
MDKYYSSTVASWYAGKNIFITGATGFMGKVLVEKLLRCCPQVQSIYILLRNKHGYDHIQRLETLLNFPIFANIRESDPNQLTKIVPLAGDVSLPNLGLSKEDADTLRKNVTVVFHCAANVRFDQKLANAINFNTGGTHRVLQLVDTFKQIHAFIHVSTAYCHCDIDELEEIEYPTPHPPEGVIDMCAWMPQQALEKITPILLDSQPNTYAYSKCLSEGFVSQYSCKFPVAIVRPSIVTAAWNEPLPGWIDNLNGPTGLLVGAGKGVIRSMHCNENYNADIMPVDIAINAVIVSAWHVGITRPNKAFVCNVTSSSDNPITWGQCLDMGRKHLYNHPFSVCLWYPDGSIKKNKFYHMLCVVFFHLIPAYFIDGLLLLLRKKPFMVRVQERIQGGLDVLQYYTTKQWKFSNKNFKMLNNLLIKEDKTVFNMNCMEIDWDLYTLKYVLGAREYCVKESPETLPQARKLLKRLYYLDRITNVCFIVFLMWIVYSCFGPLLSTIDYGFKSIIG